MPAPACARDETTLNSPPAYDGMDASAEDVAGPAGGEPFDVSVRQNAMEYYAAVTNKEKKLDFPEFCALVREREEGDFAEEELRARFDYLDSRKSGKVDLHDYLRFALRDALARSSSRVLAIFEDWDADGSGSIDRREFRRAIQSLGFADGMDREIDKVFDEFDADGSGSIEYSELNRKLRQFSGVEAINKHALRRTAGGRKGAALSTQVKLDTAPGARPVVDQMRDFLAANAVRVIDLFRDWDDDGNGMIEKSEFRQALSHLGLEARVEQYDALFDSFDADGSGTIEFTELNAQLKRRVDADAARRARRKKRAAAERRAAAGGGTKAGGGQLDWGTPRQYVSNAPAWALPSLLVGRGPAHASINEVSRLWMVPRKGWDWRHEARHQSVAARVAALRKGRPTGTAHVVANAQQLLKEQEQQLQQPISMLFPPAGPPRRPRAPARPALPPLMPPAAAMPALRTGR